MFQRERLHAIFREEILKRSALLASEYKCVPRGIECGEGYSKNCRRSSSLPSDYQTWSADVNLQPLISCRAVVGLASGFEFVLFTSRWNSKWCCILQAPPCDRSARHLVQKNYSGSPDPAVGRLSRILQTHPRT